MGELEKKDKNKLKIDKYNVLMLLFMVFIVGIIIVNTIGSVPSFDGAMNVQTAENLIKNGTYSVNYPYGSMFDVKIQTGIPVNLPTAFILRLFGKNLSNALIINYIYILFFLLITWKLVKKININKVWSMMLITLFLFTPYFFEYGTGLYGEIAMLAWIILSIFVLQSNEKNSNKYFLFSGIFYGIAYLTKTVSLIGMPAIVVIFLFKLIIEKNINKKNILFWIIGFISPIIIFELYKLIELGANGYYDSWVELFRQILTESGVKEGEIDTSNKILKLIKHISIFSNDFKINPIIFILTLVVNFYVFCKRIYSEKRVRYFDILVLTAFSYFGWWLIITTDARAWPRRIIVGVLLMELTLFDNILYIKNKFNFSKKKENIMTIIMSTFLLIIMLLNINNMYINIQNRNEEKQGIIKVSDKIKSIDNDAEFLGFGWWQAPVVSFESNKVFDNYYEVREKNNKNEILRRDTYLVVDRYAKLLANDELEDVLSNVDSELIYSDDLSYNYIYKINKFLPYKEFSKEEIDKVTDSTYNMKYDYEYLRGAYGYEENANLRWFSENSSLLLKNDLGTNQVYLNISYEIRDYDKFINKNPQIDITVNGKPILSTKIMENGIYNERININGLVNENDVAKINFKFNTKLDVKDDGRELAFILRNVSLTK